MFYVLIGIILLIIHTLFIFTTNFNVWPELYFLPYLVAKGLLPYRDFFDHHGFLLYYLVAPFTFDRTYFALKIFYYLTQSVNLILVLEIVRKNASKSAFLLGGFLYVMINFFIGENNLWYETVITTSYLSIYLLLISENFRFKSYLLGCLAALSSFIKPDAALVLLPVLWIRRDIKVMFPFVLAWILVFLYFLSQNAFSQIITDLFLFNNFLVHSYHPTFFSDYKFLASTVFLICFSTYISWKNRNLERKFLILSFLFISLVFLFTGYGRWHLLPVFTFAVILISQTLKYKKSLAKSLFIISVLIYSILLFRKVLSHRDYLNTYRISWQEDGNSQKIIAALKNINIGDKNLYVFSNHSQIYQERDLLPPAYFAVKFPGAEKYFADYEKIIISDLKKNEVSYIVVPKPMEEEYLKLPLVKNYIEQNYLPVKEDDQYQIYRRI